MARVGSGHLWQGVEALLAAGGSGQRTPRGRARVFAGF